MDSMQLTVRHVATSNAAIVIVINDILVRLAALFRHSVHFLIVYFVRRSSVCCQNSEILKLCDGSENKNGVLA